MAVDWDKADWSKTNSALAREHNVSRQRVAQARKSRAAPPSPRANAQPKSESVPVETALAAVRMRLDGWPTVAVARKFGLSELTLRTILKRYWVPKDTPALRRSRWLVDWDDIFNRNPNATIADVRREVGDAVVNRSIYQQMTRYKKLEAIRRKVLAKLLAELQENLKRSEEVEDDQDPDQPG